MFRRTLVLMQEAASASSSSAESSLAAETQVLRRKKTLPALLSTLPQSGVGSKVRQKRWAAKGVDTVHGEKHEGPARTYEELSRRSDKDHQCYWHITKVKRREDGTPARVWGQLVWRGRLTMLKPERIRGGLKWSWDVANADADVVTLEKTSDSGRNLAKHPRLVKIYQERVRKARVELGLSPEPDANGPPGLRASSAEIAAAAAAVVAAERAAGIAAAQAAQAALAAEDRPVVERDEDEDEDEDEEEEEADEEEDEALAREGDGDEKLLDKEKEEERQQEKKGFRFW